MIDITEKISHGHLSALRIWIKNAFERKSIENSETRDCSGRKLRKGVWRQLEIL